VQNPRYATAVGLLSRDANFLRGEAARAQVAGISGAAKG
jgi:hypothetical protein